MRGRVTLTILVASVALAGCGATGSSSSSTAPARTGAPRVAKLPGPRAVSAPLVVGLADGASGWGGRTTAPQLDRLTKGSGTRWLRDPFKWSVIEPSAGRFNFAYYDHYMLLAAQRGLDLSLCHWRPPMVRLPTVRRPRGQIPQPRKRSGVADADCPGLGRFCEVQTPIPPGSRFTKICPNSSPILLLF